MAARPKQPQTRKNWQVTYVTPDKQEETVGVFASEGEAADEAGPTARTDGPVQIVGAPRTGTNLMRLMVTDHLNLPAEFSRGWWKHLAPPTSYRFDSKDKTPTPRALAHPYTPFIVMVRHPLHWLEAVHRFWRARRPGVSVPNSVSRFARSRFELHDTSFDGVGPHYLFATPLDYWNHFYFAYSSWQAARAQVHFVRLEDLRERPEHALGLVATFLKIAPPAVPIALPELPVAPGQDGQAASFEPLRPFAVGPPTPRLHAVIRLARKRLEPQLIERFQYEIRT